MQADNHDTNTAVKYKTPLCIVVDQVLDPEQELYCIILDIAKPEEKTMPHIKNHQNNRNATP